MTTTPRKRDKEKTQSDILDAAIEEFMQNGFLDASTIKIAENAKVAHSTIFFYFPTKADLIVNSIYKKLNNLASKLDAQSRSSIDIRQLCKIFIRETLKSEPFYSTLIKELPLLPIDVQRMVFGSFSGFSVHFVEAIYRAQKKGKIRRFTPRISMFYWFGMINYLYSFSKILNTKELLRKRENEIIRFFMSALRK
ncbi:MAG: TetR/AcrR family transcriptional regulator [Candidatus Dojkabacteria bacterium]|jgi:AcrR family transcriptional regulator|nr:TetR/AcrR family transcriptional regulator [Candidatus Dojkabacteria bacterium]